MKAGSDCDCLICRLEQSLLDELNHEKRMEEYQRWAASSEILAPFPTVRQLLAHLHRQGNDQNSSADEVIRELVRAGASRPSRSLWQSLLLLVFIPTIHRTTSQIRAAFPSLGREDTAQHLFATLLEFLHSQELRAQSSHLAFIVARRMRRSAFRWAIRESRLELPTDWDPTAKTSEEADESHEQSHAGILLAKFLDDCQRRGWLSEQERRLLAQFKLEGIRAAELARRSGHSATAIHHRIQRLLERLRRISRKSGVIYRNSSIYSDPEERDPLNPAFSPTTSEARRCVRSSFQAGAEFCLLPPFSTVFGISGTKEKIFR
jgi:DNA-directed RNA polymerase specialized sigma24 family protein